VKAPAKTLDEIRNLDGVKNAFVEHVYQVPTDQGSTSLTALAGMFKNSNTLEIVGADSAAFTGEGISVAIIDSGVAAEAIRQAIDACRELGGKVVTVWLGFDGFDYPFQMNYEKKWNEIIRSFQEVADYGSDLKISIEYKPFEPRNYSMIDGIGLTLLAIDEIDRPNVGVTLDLCHLLMKKESPAYALTLASRKNKLFGLHLNDGYRDMDSGMIFGSVNIPQSLEFIYYLKKYAYDGVVFFDTFPVRENVEEEIALNIKSFELLESKIASYGLENFEKVINKQDGISAQELILNLLK